MMSQMAKQSCNQYQSFLNDSDTKTNAIQST